MKNISVTYCQKYKGIYRRYQTIVKYVNYLCFMIDTVFLLKNYILFPSRLYYEIYCLILKTNKNTYYFLSINKQRVSNTISYLDELTDLMYTI